MEPFLSQALRKQVTEYFSDLKEKVVILYFNSQEQTCEYCEETEQLLSELVSLSEKLSLQVFGLEINRDIATQYHVDKAPGFVIAGLDNGKVIDFGIRFYGIPAGSEFGSLVNDLLMVSNRESSLNNETRLFLAGLKDPVHLMVFSTPT
jgi:alkyl hydroperoxide reductase subunit AhpF